MSLSWAFERMRRGLYALAQNVAKPQRQRLPHPCAKPACRAVSVGRWAEHAKTRGVLAGWRALLLAMALSAFGSAFGQSLNVDLDIFFGGPDNGNGAPSDSFGAAANQPGRWNRYSGVDWGPRSLVGLNGEATGARLSMQNRFGGLSDRAAAFRGNTGDMALLLNDGSVVGSILDGNTLTFQFSGLAPGMYEVYTYAVDVTGLPTPVPVYVPGASARQTQIVVGPMPGNALIAGITHSIHLVQLGVGQDLQINVDQPPNTPVPFSINGFQIAAVPEIGPLFGLLAGVAFVPIRRLHARARGGGKNPGKRKDYGKIASIGKAEVDDVGFSTES